CRRRGRTRRHDGGRWAGAWRRASANYRSDLDGTEAQRQLGFATAGLVGAVVAAVDDLLQDVQALGHMPDNGVILLQPLAAVFRDEEELAAVRVGATVGHGYRASGVLGRRQVLVLHRVRRSAGAGAGGIPALDDEDAAVHGSRTGGVVVELLPDEVGDALYIARRRLAVERHLDRAAIGGEVGHDRLGWRRLRVRRKSGVLQVRVLGQIGARIPARSCRLAGDEGRRGGGRRRGSSSGGLRSVVVGNRD